MLFGFTTMRDLISPLGIESLSMFIFTVETKLSTNFFVNLFQDLTVVQQPTALPITNQHGVPLEGIFIPRGGAWRHEQLSYNKKEVFALSKNLFLV